MTTLVPLYRNKNPLFFSLDNCDTSYFVRYWYQHLYRFDSAIEMVQNAIDLGGKLTIDTNISESGPDCLVAYFVEFCDTASATIWILKHENVRSNPTPDQNAKMPKMINGKLVP